MSTIDEVLQKLKRFETELPYEAVRVMQEEAPIGHSGSPYHADGTLRSHIQAYPDSDGVTFVGTYNSDVPYAKYVAYGRGDVYPVRKKYLRWYAYGQPVFSKHASPAAPNDYLGRTARRVRAWIRTQF